MGTFERDTIEVVTQAEQPWTAPGVAGRCSLARIAIQRLAISVAHIVGGGEVRIARVGHLAVILGSCGHVPAFGVQARVRWLDAQLEQQRPDLFRIPEPPVAIAVGVVKGLDGRDVT